MATSTCVKFYPKKEKGEKACAIRPEKPDFPQRKITPPPKMLTSLLFSATFAITCASVGWWKPSQGPVWDIMLAGAVKPSDPYLKNVTVVDIDLFDNDAAKISQLKRNPAVRVICYFSAGSAEDWRPDYSQFPKSALGNDYDGWPGEKWLDIRNPTVRAIMKKRIEMAKAKGCDAVDPDNVDVAQASSSVSGIQGLTRTDGLAFVKFLADTAHSLDMAVGLKNYVEEIAALTPFVDFAINESCSKYGECSAYAPFTSLGKPVFAIAYEKKMRVRVCSDAKKYRLDVVIKSWNLASFKSIRC